MAQSMETELMSMDWIGFDQRAGLGASEEKQASMVADGAPRKLPDAARGALESPELSPLAPRYNDAKKRTPVASQMNPVSHV